MSDWLLTADERGNPHTGLDRRHPDGTAYTGGNEVRALVHGTEYFRDLYERIAKMTAGDMIFFTDWRGDPNQRMRGRGTEISTVLCEAADRGVIVKGLIWRSHWDRLAFSAAENEHLGDEIEAAGGECVRDMRVRPGGSHHQKMVVLRHPGRPGQDIAYVGGIDLCHSRRDNEHHQGDPQAQRIAAEYGPTPPWHDVQLAVTGPAVGDIEAGFRERWDDPAPLTRNPLHRLHDVIRREDTRPDPLPPQNPDPAPRDGHCVQVLRTYPYRRSGYPFARYGERSIARAYQKALRRARSLIYLEDQYLWSSEIAELFAGALVEHPDLRLIAVVPMYATRPDWPARRRAWAAAGPSRSCAGPGATGWRSTASRTGPVRRSTCTPRRASSTTPGPAWVRTTSASGRGRTTPSCRWPSSTTARRTASAGACACASTGSTSNGTSTTTRICRSPPTSSPPTSRRRGGSTRGTGPAAPGRGPRDACAATRNRTGG